MPISKKSALIGSPAVLMLGMAFNLAIDTHHHHDPHTPRREVNEHRRRRAMEGEVSMRRMHYGEGDPNRNAQIVELFDPETETSNYFAAGVHIDEGHIIEGDEPNPLA